MKAKVSLLLEPYVRWSLVLSGMGKRSGTMNNPDWSGLGLGAVMRSEEHLRSAIDRLSTLKFRRPEFPGGLELEYQLEAQEFRAKRM